MHQITQGRLDQVFVLGIGEGRCLVQKHNGGIFKQGPGESYPLLFTSGEKGAVHANLGPQPIRQPFDNLPAARRGSGLHHLVD